MSEAVKSLKIGRKLLTVISAILLVCFVSLTVTRKVQFSKISEAEDLNTQQSQELSRYLQENYPNRMGVLKDLPYKFNSPALNVYAESAILIDVNSGNILYSKNPDEIIPPASMTKLFAMYVVDEAVSAGVLKYDSVIPLPPECWACNMPPHSSLMFLGEGQIVTLEELLLGLSICSGNDAAYALAYAVCGSMEEFVDRMNKVAWDLGLTHTYFEESSGYSEKNTTTAREMAAFARVYLQKHPASLERFHSVPAFTYPKERNMAPGDYIHAQDWSNGLPSKITMSITQKNTNPLLGKLEGCDGLKTGYIDESGYNLSLTAIRNNTRFLSVTMRGPGNSTAEGQEGRVHDGTELMEWAFSSFSDLYKKDLSSPVFIKAYGAKEKALQLVPVRAVNDKAFCVPYVMGQNQNENLAAVQFVYEIPAYTFGQVVQGEELGVLKIILGNYVLDSIPMVADRSFEKAGGIVTLADKLIKAE